MSRFKIWLPWIGGVLLVSGILAALDGRGEMLSGWPAYFALCAMSAVMIWLAWRWVAAGDGPRWLMVVLGVALALRLGVGIALTYALPRFGYDEDPQRAGYVFYDAFIRDGEAWSLATSDKMLLSAFTERSESDQYGGLLYLSALTYRTLSPDVHRPLLIVVLAAVISSLAVLFTWGFATMTFGPGVAAFGAWVVTLYPDAIMLGASQMREPFVGTALAIVLYGYGVLRLGRLKQGLLTMLVPALVLALPISPPYALAILGVVGGAWLWEKRLITSRSKWFIMPLLGLALVATLLVVQSWSTIGDLSSAGFDVLLEWWKSAGAQWQLNLLWMQSDWTRHLFRGTPEWAHLPLIVVYGLIRPFLPAAIVDHGAPLWRMIAILRGVGWIVLLPFLLYAPLAALRRSGRRGLPTYLSLVVWLTAILASYRGAGDQWDNPRYRFVFVTVQAALAGWAWVNARQISSPWLRRTALVVGISTGLFTLWYSQRYNWLPYFSVVHAVGVVGTFIILFLGGSILYDVLRERQTDA